jgi:hypothetical protein
MLLWMSYGTIDAADSESFMLRSILPLLKLYGAIDISVADAYIV